MATEIKRNTWSRFCRKFNETNQYRQATVCVQQRNQNEIEINRDCPFMGIAVTKKGRLIDGIEFFTAQYDPHKLYEPILVVKQPVRILLEKDENGMDNHLSVESKDGTVAHIDLSGERDSQRYYSVVEKLAYSIGERRGFAPGGDRDDWLEAERKIKEAELQFVQ